MKLKEFFQLIKKHFWNKEKISLLFTKNYQFIFLLIHSNQGLCTVYGCEKPSIYAGLCLITITLLRPKNRRAIRRVGFFSYIRLAASFWLSQLYSAKAE